MPRKSRSNSKSNFFHVIVQGINKEFIFSKSKDIEKYRSLILSKLENSNINILSYCIMNNHAHFLIFCEDIKYLSKFMQRLNTSYSYYYNNDRNRIGFVFRDRYYSQNILNQNQLFNCLKYIHNNPVKAKMVNYMYEYSYSSYNEFLHKKIIISDKSIKLLFGNTTDYLEQFLYIHKHFNDQNFYDIKHVSLSNFIIEIEKRYHCKIYDLKNNKSLLKDVIKEARNMTDATISQLANVFQISNTSVFNYIHM